MLTDNIITHFTPTTHLCVLLTSTIQYIHTVQFQRGHRHNNINKSGWILLAHDVSNDYKLLHKEMQGLCSGPTILRIIQYCKQHAIVISQ